MIFSVLYEYMTFLQYCYENISAQCVLYQVSFFLNNVLYHNISLYVGYVVKFWHNRANCVCKNEQVIKYFFVQNVKKIVLKRPKNIVTIQKCLHYRH